MTIVFQVGFEIITYLNNCVNLGCDHNVLEQFRQFGCNHNVPTIESAWGVIIMYHDHCESAWGVIIMYPTHCVSLGCNSNVP